MIWRAPSLRSTKQAPRCAARHRSGFVGTRAVSRLRTRSAPCSRHMPAASERAVLHVLPHPGGGGETYVDLLDDMPGYRFERAYLAPSASTSPTQVLRRTIVVLRRARAFDLVHVHGEVASALCLPALATHRSVVTLHGLHLVRRVSGVRRTAATLGLRGVLRVADRTICVSESEHAELVRAVGEKAAHDAAVIRNGVELQPTIDPAVR